MNYRRLIIPGATYFFTLVTHHRAPLFTDPANIDRWRRAAAKIQVARPFVLDAEVLMPDHLHMIWTLPDADADYATRIRLIKTAFTKDFLARDPAPATNQSRAKKGEREVWQRRYWEHTIRDERDFGRLADYIHYNPVEAGLVKAPGDWPHSTFRAWAAGGAHAPGWGVDTVPEM